MAGTNITQVSTAPGATIIKQGHTTNGKFGSDPNVKVKGSSAVRDLNPPSTGRR